MPQDKFRNYPVSLDSPATDAFVIGPSDENDLDYTTRAINVAVAGAVNLRTVDGTTVYVTLSPQALPSPSVLSRCLPPAQRRPASGG